MQSGPFKVHPENSLNSTTQGSPDHFAQHGLHDHPQQAPRLPHYEEREGTQGHLGLAEPGTAVVASPARGDAFMDSSPDRLNISESVGDCSDKNGKLSLNKKTDVTPSLILGDLGQSSGPSRELLSLADLPNGKRSEDSHCSLLFFALHA